jgi:hypothetical protein
MGRHHHAPLPLHVEMRQVRTHILIGLEEWHRARQRLEMLGRHDDAALLSELIRKGEDIHEALKREATH